MGSYPAAGSPRGTFDQGGNVWEWNEAIIFTTNRGCRGGNFDLGFSVLASGTRCSDSPALEVATLGFRVATLPEPNADAVALAGVLLVAGLRRWGRAQVRTGRVPVYSQNAPGITTSNFTFVKPAPRIAATIVSGGTHFSTVSQ